MAQKRKMPTGWTRAGPGDDVGDYPDSVARDRNVHAVGSLHVGSFAGHTHARFEANSGCCPMCKALDGKVFRLNTILSWKFPLVHPNCKCSWTTFSPTLSSTKASLGRKFNQLLSSKKGDLGMDTDVLVGETLGLVDFIKANPTEVIEAWGKKMKREGGDKPFDWCVKSAGFADDPEAFCSAVHEAAYGKTPSERAASKKGSCG